jgi:hypothetical protein
VARSLILVMLGVPLLAQPQPLSPANAIRLLDSANRDVALSAFDALIRLNADVPESNLASFLNERETLEPVLVLLARDSKAHATFLMPALDQPLGDHTGLP